MDISAIAVIPAYRPDERIFTVAADLKKSGFRHIVVVDDGNGAECAELFDKLACDPAVTVCTHSCNLGKGRAIKTAFNFILSHWPGCASVCIDCDGQLSADDAARAAEYAESYPDSLILGCRDLKHTPNVPLPNRFGNAATKLTVFLLTGLRFSDTQCGLRAYPPTVMRKLIGLPGDRFEFENNTLLAVRAEGIDIVEFPIKVVYEPESAYTTTFRRVRDSALIYKNLLKFLSAPVISFLLASVIWFFVSSFFSSDISSAFSYTAMLILCTALSCAGVRRSAMFFSGGCILSVVTGTGMFGLLSAGLSSELAWLCAAVPFFAVLIPLYRNLGFERRPRFTRC